MSNVEKLAKQLNGPIFKYEENDGKPIIGFNIVDSCKTCGTRGIAYRSLDERFTGDCLACGMFPKEKEKQ